MLRCADRLAPTYCIVRLRSSILRAPFVEQSVGPVAPGVVQYTTDPLFHDLWLRPALARRTGVSLPSAL